MASPTEFHDGGKDTAGPQEVFHTPPEEHSLHSSEEQRPAVAADVDLCAVNQAVDVGDGSQAFVDFGGYSDEADFADLGKDSDLGFSEGEVVDAEVVADVEGDVSGEDSKRKLDEIRVSESDFPVKKLKPSEQDLGFGSSGDFLGAESVKIEAGLRVSDAETETLCDLGADSEPQENVLGGEKKLSSDDENVEIQDFEAEIMENAGPVSFSEPKKSSDNVLEASGTEEKSDVDSRTCVLPPTICESMDEEEMRLEPLEEVVKEKTTIFTVLQFLAENCDDEDEDLENVSPAAKLSGITFPCPRWWPENYESLGFNTSGMLLTRDESWRK